MSKEAMEAVLANSTSKGGPRGVLLALAWKTFDRRPPFKGPFTVRYIAALANVQDRQARADIATLRKLGELVVTGKSGREYVYGVNVACANYAASDIDNYAASDIDNYAASDIVTAHDHTNYAASDIDNYAASDIDNYAASDIVTMQHPAYGSYKETRNKIVTRGNVAPAILDNNLTGQADAEQTPPPSPPPQPARDVQALWVGIQRIMTEDFSEAQQESWLRRVVPGWSGPGILCLRVTSSFQADLLKTRYKLAIEAAAWKITGKKTIVEVKRI